MQNDASKATHPKIHGKRANDSLGFLLVADVVNLDHDKNTRVALKKKHKKRIKAKLYPDS